MELAGIDVLKDNLLYQENVKTADQNVVNAQVLEPVQLVNLIIH
jgi:hypothetical protein